MASSTTGKKSTQSARKSQTGKKAGNRTGTRTGRAQGTSSSGKSVKRTVSSGSSAARAKKAAATGKKASSVRRAGNSRRKEYMDYSIQIEVLLWVMIAFSVYCFISMLGFGGRLGDAIAGILGGCFGIMGYIFPLALLLMSAFLISNSGSYIAKIKTAGAVMLFILLCAVMQLGLVGYTSGYTMAQYFEAGQMYMSGGGVTGGAIVSFFASGLGVVGTWLILIILMIIALILITQRSVIRTVSRAGRRAAASARAGREERAVRREAYLEELEKERAVRAAASEVEKESGRRRKSVSGVTENTLLDKQGAVRRVKPGTSDLISLQEKETSKQKTSVEKSHTSPRFFPDLLDDLQTADTTGSSDPVISAEPGAMNRLRGTVKNARTAKPPKAAESSAGDHAAKQIPEVLPDDIFKNAFNKSEKAAAAAAKQAEAEEKETAAPHSEVSENEGAQTQSVKESRSPRKVRVSEEELQNGIDSVAAQIEEQEAEPKPVYVYPDVSLLQKPSRGSGHTTEQELRETAAKLQKVFETFHVNVHITDVTCGPSVTRYELTPELGVKVSKIVSLQDDIKLNLAAQDIRIEAPIPGKAAVGIEVPNKKPTGVMLRELLESEEYQNHKSKLAYVVGKDIAGNIIVSDIAKMPHLLIAGATGSGKSVFIHTLIMSILYRASPDEVKLIMIDPKVVELSVYNGIPHLFIPVVTDPKKAAGALNWAVTEMMKRYQMFAETGVRDLKGYNKRVAQLGDVGDAEKPEKLPQIVIIVDELADLMMVASADVEDAICRLAQLARAAGIHLVIATQRPSVDVITGLIKANMPSRIALSVSSGVDSRTVLDQVGAEKLLGNGDMLFAPQQYKQPLRVQGAYISDNEVAAVTGFLKEKNHSEAYDKQMQERLETVARSASSSAGGDADTDELFAQAGKLIIEKDKASIGMLQRWFKIGFNRAARIMDQLSDAGVVGPEEGTKPRKVLMSAEEFENYLEQN